MHLGVTVQRLEHQYKRVVRQTLVGVAICQAFLVVVWLAALTYIDQILGDNADGIVLFAKYLITLAGFPSLAALGYWRIRRFERFGWKDRNPEVDFSEDWYLIARVSVVSPNPDAKGLPKDSEADSVSLEGAELHALVHISQTPVSVSVDNTTIHWRVPGSGAYLPISTIKSTSMRLSERGQEVHLSYVVNRVASAPPTALLGDRGVMRLAVSAYEDSVDTKPLKLLGTFADALGSGAYLARGSIEMFRRIQSQGSARSANYHEVGLAFPTVDISLDSLLQTFEQQD